jgi:3-oxoacyl-[acyl-carrier-protein] synthase II
MEASVYQRFFDGAASGPLITALKGATGEIFASGGIRAASLALSIREGMVPPTVGLHDPLCTLPFVIGEARPRSVRKALLSGISFGGTYACLVFEKEGVWKS